MADRARLTDFAKARLLKSGPESLVAKAFSFCVEESSASGARLSFQMRDGDGMAIVEVASEWVQVGNTITLDHIDRCLTFLFSEDSKPSRERQQATGVRGASVIYSGASSANPLKDKRGSVQSEPAMDSEGNWNVLVRFDGENRFLSVDVSFLTFDQPH